MRISDWSSDVCSSDLVYSLQRYPAGEAPKVDQEWSQDHGDVDFWGLILTQDYQNMAEVQKGMKSKAFKGAKPNPRQEIAVINFHRSLDDFIENGYGARSEEHTSEIQSLMRTSYAVSCLRKKKKKTN